MSYMTCFAAGEIGECLGQLVDFSNGGPTYGTGGIVEDVGTDWILAKHYFPVKNVTSQNKEVLIKLKGPGNYYAGTFGSKVLNIRDIVYPGTVRLYLLDTVTSYASGSEEFSALGYMDFTIQSDNTINVTANPVRRGTIAHIGGCFKSTTQDTLASFGYKSQYYKRTAFEGVRIISTNVDTLVEAGWKSYYVSCCAGKNLSDVRGVPTETSRYSLADMPVYTEITASFNDSLTDISSNACDIKSQSTNTTETGWYSVTSEYAMTTGKISVSAAEENKAAPWGACSVYEVVSADTTPPLGIIRIKQPVTLLNGKEAVNTRNVILQIMAVDNESGIVEMALANENARSTPIAWESYTGGSIEKAWQLSAGDGEKTVYAMFKNSAGVTTVTFSE